MKRLAVLISGRGSNLRAIHAATVDGRLGAEVSVVVSNQPDALGLAWAEQQGLRVVCLPSRGVDREAYDQQLGGLLEEAGVDLVVLAGFMRLLTGSFIDRFPNRIVNIHPSLLPSFPGLHAQRQALEYGVKWSGCTVHWVTEQMDAGPILRQAVVPVLDDDTEESLTERILVEEHRIYPEAIGMVLRGEVRVLGRRVVGVR
jgi:phosphoribosylglycinamide formyltransferase-1